ncbi:NAD-dependent epimerase/dehydratase family protein [Streptomyces sp. NPDC056909]|uniref:NAD-dependent epimerase/dehydratase family protein n=1 Tax=Streptomyces sp. NPDC056909 TaxID=3345963 RepID=UPI0036B15694
MTLLIIGAGGFLGGELVRQATASGHAVAGTFARNPGRLSGIKWLPLDLRDREAIASALDEVRPHTVINTASRKADWATTAEGAIRFGRGCRAVRSAARGERGLVDPSALPAGRRADTGVAGPLDVRLDSSGTQRGLRVRVRGAREFLSVNGPDTGHVRPASAS